MVVLSPKKVQVVLKEVIPKKVLAVLAEELMIMRPALAEVVGAHLT